jgi:hypothetical protein
MKISQETFDVLKNFSTINNALAITEPNALKTLSIAENIIGIYDCPETFPEVAHIYNSVPLMSLVSMVGIERCDFNFGKDNLGIKVTYNEKDVNTVSKIDIRYDDADMIPILGNLKESSVYKKFSDWDASFTLPHVVIGWLQKAANIMGVPDMTVKMADGKGMITIVDSENPDSNTWKTAIKGEGSCTITMMVKNMVVVDGVYTVRIANDKIGKFELNDSTLFYIVAAKQV